MAEPRPPRAPEPPSPGDDLAPAPLTPGPGRRWVDAGAFEALRAEVATLRLRLADEVRTRRIVLVDETGVGRIRLTADDDVARIALLGRDGFERMTLTAEHNIGTVVVSSRAHAGPTRVDLFALDPDDEADRGVAGLELIDGGNSVAGFTVYEGDRATVWTEPLAGPTTAPSPAPPA